MHHKISELCDLADVLAFKARQLRDAKYHEPVYGKKVDNDRYKVDNDRYKVDNDRYIDYLISDIKYLASLIANDNGDYRRDRN